MCGCYGSMARYFSHASSAIHMEAEACRAGLLMAIHQGWSNVELECDCASLVNALSTEQEDFSEIGRIIDDCRVYTLEVRPIHIRHIYREANGVAHRLANLASCSFLDDLWLDETPAIIQDVLFEDICKCSRGLGTMSPSRSSPIININNLGGLS